MARPPTAPGARPGRSALPGLTVALGFVLAGLATLGDYGMTWDEIESYRAGLQNHEILRAAASGSTDFEWPWHELPGYQFAFDAARAAFARLAAPLVGGAVLSEPGLAPVPIQAFHLFHLLLTGATLFLVYRIGLEEGGRVRIGVLCALVLATTPKLVAHAQNNPKDSIGLFAFTLTLWAVARATRSAREEGGGRAAFAWAGAALGLALASHVLSALLLPIAAAWVLWRHPGSLRARAGSLAVFAGVAAAAAFALWPWLWGDPVIRTARALRRVATYRVEIDVLYLGRTYAEADPPFHYFLGSLLVATPVVFTLAAVLGAAAAWRGRSAAAPSPLARLALLWLGVPVVVEALTGARYDGVRHLLVVLPALALLAGLGLDRLLDLARAGAGGAGGRTAARAALALAAGAWLWLLADLVRYHPYQDAYLNAPVRAALDRPGEELFELEYWGGSYKEGAEWLNAHAEAGAVVEVPIAAWCAAPFLDPRLVLEGPEWLGEPELAAAAGLEPAGPRYLMVMTRQTFYTPRVIEVRRRLDPVFTVERFGATLLEVYRLEAG